MSAAMLFPLAVIGSASVLSIAGARPQALLLALTLSRPLPLAR